ncbi:MAG: trehalase, partial [Chitinophagaceae bacterium]
RANLIAQRLQKDFLKAGGLVATPVNTGQQWDAPNGWAPLQWIAVSGLQNYGNNALAREVSNRWVSLNLKVYRKIGKLLEKYNVVDTTLAAGGGEYPTQDGFGWTNGVLLKLLAGQGTKRK